MVTLEFIYANDLSEWLQILVLGFILSLPVCHTIESFKSTGITKGWFYLAASMIVSAGFGFGFAFAFTDMNLAESAWLSFCLWMGSQGFYTYLQQSDGWLGKSFVSLTDRFGLQDVVEKKPESEEVVVPPKEEVAVSLPSPESRNFSLNQLKVLVKDLRVRKAPAGDVLGYATKGGYYTYSEVKKDGGVTWYKVGDCWLGDSGDGDVAVCLSGAMMRFPVNYIGITTPFSKKHPAVDFGFSNSHGGKNQPIIAPCDMKVVAVGNSDVVGKYIRAHLTYEGVDYTFRFIHMSATEVKEGQLVKGGEVIGKMGDTGSDCAGFHLHFDIWKGHTADLAGTSSRYAKSVNPLTICRLADGQIVGDETDEEYEILRV